MSVIETFEKRRKEVADNLAQGYRTRVAENRGKVEEVRKAAEAEIESEKAGVDIFQARKNVADRVREATERAEDMQGLAGFDWSDVVKRVEWQAERMIKAENPELYAEYRRAVNRLEPESVYAEYQEAIHEIVDDLVRDFRTRITLRGLDLADLDTSIDLHMAANPELPDDPERTARDWANRQIEMQLEKVALEKEIAEMEIAVKYGVDSDVLWLKARDFIREADPDLHERYQPIHQQQDKSEYCLAGIDRKDYDAVQAVYNDTWNQTLNYVMCGVEVQRCASVYGIQEAQLQLQYLENNKERLIAVTNAQQAEPAELYYGTDSPWEAEMATLQGAVGYFERRMPKLDEMVELGRDASEVYRDVGEIMGTYFEGLVEKYTALVNDGAREITDKRIADAQVAMENDFKAKTAIDIYFKAFTGYVDSMQVKLKTLSLHQYQLQDGQDGLDKKRDTMSDDSGPTDELNAEIRLLEELCKDEVLYAAAHETAVRSLTDEQAARFEQTSPIEVYDRLVVNYAEKYRRDKHAENDFMHRAHGYAIGNKSRLNREGWSASMLRHAEADVGFAAYKAEIFHRYVGNATLLDADCRSEAHVIMPICHPEITENAIEAERAVHRGLTGDEAVEAYRELQENYMNDYTGYDSGEWRLALDEVVGAHLALREHELHEPTLFDSLITGGKAKSQWLSVGKQYHDAFIAASEEFRDIDSARHSIGGIAWEMQAREEADITIRSVYPELCEKVQEHINGAWQKNNSERLEREMQRLAEDKEQSGSHDLTR